MPRFLVEPPPGDALTAYDREHMVLYLRLLDSARDGACWREVMQILFEFDPDREPDKCRHIYDAHPARAQWMCDHGYQQLIRERQQSEPM
jgi:hypothetical protein